MMGLMFCYDWNILNDQFWLFRSTFLSAGNKQPHISKEHMEMFPLCTLHFYTSRKADVVTVPHLFPAGSNISPGGHVDQQAPCKNLRL